MIDVDAVAKTLEEYAERLERECSYERAAEVWKQAARVRASEHDEREVY